jgi:hypothetical protein
MKLESKIRDLLDPSEVELDEANKLGPNVSTKESEPMAQGSSQKAKVGELTHSAKKQDVPNPLGPGVAAKEEEPMKQGSSQDASVEELDREAPGKTAAAKAKETTKKPTASGAGAAPNFTTVADPSSVVNQSSSKGNVQREEAEASLAQIFSEENVELSEDFKTKTASLFEAVVTARVADRVEQIEAELVEEAEEVIGSIKAELVEKLDNYLTYVASRWLEENQLAVDEGLRSDVTESFMEGLRSLFMEHDIAVPEESEDVLAQVVEEAKAIEADLEEKLEENVLLVAEINRLRRAAVFTEVCEGLAKTEVEKLRALTEDVTFENESLFKEKLAVIKESYFPKSPRVKVEKLEEETEQVNELSGVMSQYARAISATSRF